MNLDSQRLPRFAFFLVFVFHLLSAAAQNILSEMDHDAQRTYDRMIVLSGGGPLTLHASLLSFWRKDLVALADSFARVAQDPIDWSLIQSIWDQNNEFTRTDSGDTLGMVLGKAIPAMRYRQSSRPLWHTFYKTPAHFYEVDVPDFYLRIDPMIRVGAGRETEEGVTTFINQRGLSLRGGISNSVFFQTNLFDSQIRFPNYINQYTDVYGVVPGAGLFKAFSSKIFNSAGGRDFLLANAYMGFNLGKYIGIQLGHNTCFIGSGIRSLLISDFSTPYFSLKINTRIWKFHYQNIFAELAADNFESVSGYSGVVPKKYMAAHYLDFKASSVFSVGLFEAVVFNRANHQFELQYLNPVILYRTIEGTIGSPDNVVLGLNTRLDLWRRVLVYGQFLLDDISISTILDGHLDWWGNKFGHQLGAKWLNAFGLDHLDLQTEWNSVRPYTYSHYDSNANYSHYKQALAHPLGANFNEWILSGTYAINSRLFIKSDLYVIETGEDADSVSYGGDILIPNTRRASDYGNHIGQGAKANILIWQNRFSYEITPGLVVDGTFLFRKKTGDLVSQALNTRLFQLGVRYNMAFREDVF